MTFTKDNIVGVEFTVRGIRKKILYKVLRQNTEYTVVIGWVIKNTKSEVSAGIKDVVNLLNNGTWIPTPKK